MKTQWAERQGARRPLGALDPPRTVGRRPLAALDPPRTVGWASPCPGERPRVPSSLGAVTSVPNVPFTISRPAVDLARVSWVRRVGRSSCPEQNFRTFSQDA